MALVKICGITNWGDAKAAVDAGADCWGLSATRTARAASPPTTSAPSPRACPRTFSGSASSAARRGRSGGRRAAACFTCSTRSNTRTTACGPTSSGRTGTWAARSRRFRLPPTRTFAGLPATMASCSRSTSMSTRRGATPTAGTGPRDPPVRQASVSGGRPHPGERRPGRRPRPPLRRGCHRRRRVRPRRERCGEDAGLC